MTRPRGSVSFEPGNRDRLQLAVYYAGDGVEDRYGFDLSYGADGCDPVASVYLEVDVPARLMPALARLEERLDARKQRRHARRWGPGRRRWLRY